MYIYSDVDEVLWDSIKSVLTTLNKRYNTNYKSNQVTTWNFTNLYSNMTNEEIEDIFDSDDFFKNISFKPYAEEWLKYQYNHNNITLVTHGSETNLLKKRKWFNENGFKNINFIGLPHSLSKGNIDMNGSLFIDDCRKNLEESNGTYKILFENNKDGEWLQGWNGIRIKSFKELY